MGPNGSLGPFESMGPCPCPLNSLGLGLLGPYVRPERSQKGLGPNGPPRPLLLSLLLLLLQLLLLLGLQSIEDIAFAAMIAVGQFEVVG